MLVLRLLLCQRAVEEHDPRHPNQFIDDVADLDGNAIMESLGLPPGPPVDRAWRHFKEVRLDCGPLTCEEAELRRWAQDKLPE